MAKEVIIISCIDRTRKEIWKMQAMRRADMNDGPIIDNDHNPVCNDDYTGCIVWDTPKCLQY